jgi:hypothetical protein
MYKENRLKPIIIAGAITFVIIIGVSIIFLSGIFHKNPYGNQVKITDFSHYYKDAPQDTKDSVFASLYNILQENNPETDLSAINDAKIRNGSEISSYSDKTKLHYGNFIIDIPSLQQSYRGQFQWSNEKDQDAELSGYSSLIICLESDLIYPKFNCKDLFTGDPLIALTAKYPIINQLPYNITYYSNNYSEYTNYTINYKITDNQTNIVLVINDQTGGNEQNALDEIRKLGFNPSDYTIEYNNLSTEPTPGRAPNDAL